jgi:N-methylhydantoinase B/oxoprolinase/acetone carboxylase alpha subunit
MRVTEGAEVTANAVLDRTKPGFGAWGLDGGGLGGPAAIRVKRRGDTEFRTFSEVFGTASPSKFTNVELHEGDEVLIESPGGGGYGDPHERDPERVREDVAQGFVSPESARALYGWEG